MDGVLTFVCGVGHVFEMNTNWRSTMKPKHIKKIGIASLLGGMMLFAVGTNVFAEQHASKDKADSKTQQEKKKQDDKNKKDDDAALKKQKVQQQPQERKQVQQQQQPQERKQAQQQQCNCKYK
jgi:hypothetical protein